MKIAPPPRRRAASIHPHSLSSVIGEKDVAGASADSDLIRFHDETVSLVEDSDPRVAW